MWPQIAMAAMLPISTSGSSLCFDLGELIAMDSLSLAWGTPVTSCGQSQGDLDPAESSTWSCRAPNDVFMSGSDTWSAGRRHRSVADSVFVREERSDPVWQVTDSLGAFVPDVAPEGDADLWDIQELLLPDTVAQSIKTTTGSNVEVTSASALSPGSVPSSLFELNAGMELLDTGEPNGLELPVVGDLFAEYGIPMDLQALNFIFTGHEGQFMPPVTPLDHHPLYPALVGLMQMVQTAIYEPSSASPQADAQFKSSVAQLLPWSTAYCLPDGRVALHRDPVLDNFVFASLGIYRALLEDVTAANAQSMVRWHDIKAQLIRQAPSILSRKRAHAGDKDDNSDSNCSDTPSRGSKRTVALPSEAVSLLKQWLYAHLLKPYPDDDDKDMLVACTGLSVSQINNWFINARRRILKPRSVTNSPWTT